MGVANGNCRYAFPKYPASALAFGTSIAVGIFLVAVLEASDRVRLCSDEWGDGIGEKDLSENVVVEDTGDVLPPQPKNDPSLDAPGDFGKGLFVMLESCDSLEYVRDTALGMFMLCGGVGLFENMDIVAEGGTLVELESLYHGAADSDADVRADSLVNLACFAKGAPAGRVCCGTARFGLLGLVACVGVVTR